MFSADFLGRLFLSDFDDGYAVIWLIFLADVDMFAKFVGVFVVFHEWFWWIVKMDYFQLDGLYE